MAKIHPDTHFSSLKRAGAYRELEVIDTLDLAFSKDFDIFHNLDWSAMKAGNQAFGELDVVMVSPQGHIVLLEVKAGPLIVEEGHLKKEYKKFGFGLLKDVGHQTKRQLTATKNMLAESGFENLHISQFLVLPDYQVDSASIFYPKERIIDADNYGQMVTIIKNAFNHFSSAIHQRAELIQFLSKHYRVKHDYQNHIRLLQKTNKELASGLATWVPKIKHESGVYVINATAGSGKTQLAIELLKQEKNKKKAYICFNRSLADHMQKIVGPHTEVYTFHSFCLAFVKSQVANFDVKQDNLFQVVEIYFLAHFQEKKSAFDLLVVDESQDFKAEWIGALSEFLNPESRFYLMGDPEQNIYDKEVFEISNSVTIESKENHRSPQKIVDAINLLKLSSSVIESRSVYVGFHPEFITYYPESWSLRLQVQKSIKSFITEGFTADQIAVISFSGKDNSKILGLDSLGEYSIKRPLFTYDSAGNALWTEGDILVDSIYRFKGQSAAAVVFCEVDFDAIDTKTLRKLLVGFTRAQVKLTVVITEKASTLLIKKINEESIDQ